MIFDDENFRFPYRLASFPSEINGIKTSILKNHVCSYSTFEMFNGRDFYYIPKDCFITAYNYDFFQYLISPSLKPNFAGMVGRAFVPAHSSIGLKSSSENTDIPPYDIFNNQIWERYEMFAMNCDKVSNNVSIAPTLEGVNIEKVEINGETVEPVGSRYNADFSEDVSITVYYNFKNQISMSTDYAPSFIATLPHNPKDSSGVITSLDDPELHIAIYSLSGYLIYDGPQLEVPKLQSGFYIVKHEAITSKIYVK